MKLTVLRETLKAKNISQNKLSHMASISASNLSACINGKCEMCPGWKKRIAQALEMDEGVLFPEKEVIG